MKNNTKLLISGQGSADEKNTETASNVHDVDSADDFDFKLSRELRKEIIKAVLLIMKTYNNCSKGMNKKFTKEEFEYYLDLTPYGNLTKDKEPNVDAKDSLVLRAAVSCLFLCIEVKNDKMYSDLFGRDIFAYEHIFKNEKDVEDFEVNISNSLSGFTQVHYNYLKSLYTQAESKAELAKLAFSDVLMFAARLRGKFDSHLSSAGSKKWAMQLFHLDMIKFIDNQKKVLIDVFSRTASIPLSCMGVFDEIHCGDKDIRFVNFYEVLREYPVALILRIKSICINYQNELQKLQYDDDDKNKFCNALHKELNKRANKDLHKACRAIKIDAAACLLLSIRFSFKGFCKDFNIDEASSFINKLDTVCYDLLYTSMILLDKDNSRKIQKGIYKKTVSGLAYERVDEVDTKNTVSVCPISYEHWGFMKAIEKYKDDSNNTIILDPPYPRQFLFPCGDYNNMFTNDHMLSIFRALKGAKCKVILFNSENIDYLATAQRYGFRLVGTYKKDKNSTEVTQVYSLNIDPEEKFFDPGEHDGQR